MTENEIRLRIKEAGIIDNVDRASLKKLFENITFLSFLNTNEQLAEALKDNLVNMPNITEEDRVNLIQIQTSVRLLKSITTDLINQLMENDNE